MEEVKMGCQTENDQNRQFVDSSPTCPKCGSICMEVGSGGKYYCNKCGNTFIYSSNKIF